MEAGAIRLEGRAWSGGAPIARVEVSVDGGASWSQAQLLEDLGLVRHNHISDRAPTYHSTATPDHVHLVCRGCGTITEVAPEVVTPMTDTLREEYGFTTDIGHLTVFGMCRECVSRHAAG